MIIKGRHEVESYYQKRIDKEWKKLDLRYRKVRWKILTSLLYMINYVFRPKIHNQSEFAISPLSEDMLKFRLLLRILDELLIREWNLIDLYITEEEILTFSEKITNEFTIMGQLRNGLVNSRIAKTQEIEVENDIPTNLASEKLMNAYREWWSSNQPHEGWIEFYYNTSRMAKDDIAKTLRSEFQARYGLTQEIFVGFEKAIITRIDEHLKNLLGKSIPFAHFGWNQLVAPLIPHVGRKDAESWIKELLYSPDRNFARSPLVETIDNRTKVYVPIIAAFIPLDSFGQAWMYHLTKDTKKSSLAGKMTRDWGDIFEKYVRNELEKTHPELTVDPTHSIISSQKFPDLKNCFGEIHKNRIELDVIAYSEHSVYFISCKARDMYAGAELVKDIFFVSFEDFEEMVEQDIEDAGEIENYTRCLGNSPSYLRSRGFQDKKVIPLLVTADLRPLSLASVQKWLPSYRRVPNVSIVQAKQLHNFDFD